jgi:iron(III) transport system permease protein
VRGGILERVNPSRTLILFCVPAAFTVILVFPLAALFSKAFLDPLGEFVGFANYRLYFGTATLRRSLINTVDISAATTLFSVTLGFMYAYALTRTNIGFKAFFRYAALTPIFIPTIVHALALVYCLGRQGILTRMGFRVELYGRLGIVLSEIIYTFPQAFLMFFVALEFADGRLYEAADTMGASGARKFFAITLPEVKYTVVNAFFVCFTLAFTDFGAPKVIGGNFNVLATDIYKQIVGQFNMNMGAVVGTLLLIPAFISFAVGHITSGINTSTLNARSTKLNVGKNPARDAFFFVFCSLVTLCFAGLILSLFIGGLSEYYPYNMKLTLKNFIFNKSTGGIGSFFNSLEMSALTAIFGTAFVFLYAYMMEKTDGFAALRRYGKLLAVIPLALPGMVVGLSFIFFFNSSANPLNFIYGTVAILVLSNVLHFFSVPFLTASASLRQLDAEFERVADSMGVPWWRTFFSVSLPLCMPAIFEIFTYFFVNSMVTVSAVVFLYGPNFKIAAIAITHMEEAGDVGQAAAMSLLILFINVFARAVYEAAMKLIIGRKTGWED